MHALLAVAEPAQSPEGCLAALGQSLGFCPRRSRHGNVRVNAGWRTDHSQKADRSTCDFPLFGLMPEHFCQRSVDTRFRSMAEKESVVCRVDSALAWWDQ